MKLLIRPVQIRVRRPSSGLPRYQEFALAASSLLAPCALISFTLVLWNLAAGRWQAWLASAALLSLLALFLARAAHPEHE